MTTYLGKSCSFGVLCLSCTFLNFCVSPSFPFGFEDGMLDVIILIHEHCLSNYFIESLLCYL